MCIKDRSLGVSAGAGEHVSVGILGEQIAINFLVGKGFSVLQRNVKLGHDELDAVVQKDGVIHFIEVKTGSIRVWQQTGKDAYMPEGHMHERKCANMTRAIEQYFLRYRVPPTTCWTADLIVVLIHAAERTARVRVLPDILLGR